MSIGHGPLLSAARHMHAHLYAKRKSRDFGYKVSRFDANLDAKAAELRCVWLVCRAILRDKANLPP